MDSDHLLSYRVNNTGLSYSSRPSIPTRLFGSLKFDTRNSPNSPFSNHFDCETNTIASDTPEQYSSTENHSLSGTENQSFSSSGASPSYNSSHENSNSFQGSHESSPLISGEFSFVQNTNNGHNVHHTLQNLENALMGPDEEEVTRPDSSWGRNQGPQILGQRSISMSQDQRMPQMFQSQPLQASYGSSYEKGNRMRTEKRHRSEEVFLQNYLPSNLKQLLFACARSLSENRVDDFDKLIETVRSAVSITGDPIQRLGAYMVEGLVARKEESGHNIYRALRCREPEGKDLLSYMHILYEICPYLKFGYMAANGAIAEACRNEDRIHIIDFQIAQGTQWMTLLQALAARPKGAPFVRITGIDDPVSKYARGASLEAVGKRLQALSEKFNIPVEFHAMPAFAPDVTKDMLGVRPGEALVVNFPLQLHHTPDESVDVNNPRDGLLRTVKSLSPKVVTLVEQESNTNTAPFFPRFVEALEYYAAMFESIDVSLPRDRKERINVEQHCLARDIVNVIACEGKQRVERHELLGKWKSRLTMAGFKQFPLSPYVNSVIRGLLKSYSEHYKLEEIDGAMLLGWKARNLISASAWH